MEWLSIWLVLTLYIYIYISYIRIYRSRSCHHADCWTCGFAKQVSLLAFETTDVSWALAHLGLNWVNFSVQDLIAAALKRRLSCWCSGPERGGPAEGQILARLSVKALQCQCVCVTKFLEELVPVPLQLVRAYMIYGWSMDIIGYLLMECGSVLAFWGYPGLQAFKGERFKDVWLHRKLQNIRAKFRTKELSFPEYSKTNFNFLQFHAQWEHFDKGKRKHCTPPMVLVTAWA